MEKIYVTTSNLNSQKKEYLIILQQVKFKIIYNCQLKNNLTQALIHLILILNFHILHQLKLNNKNLLLKLKINKNEIKNEQLSQEDLAKQSLLKDVQLDNLENIFTLFISTAPINQSNIQTSTLMTSIIEPQYYQQLEIDAEKINDHIKMEGRTVHTIFQKKLVIEYDLCTSYSKFQNEIKYILNQFESKADELRDIINEAFNFMSVVSVTAYEKLNKAFDESEIVSEAEFTSISLKHFSDIELIAKEYEQVPSEKKRLGNINQNYQQYKSICSKLLKSIKSFLKQEQDFQQKMIHLQIIISFN